MPIRRRNDVRLRRQNGALFWGSITKSVVCDDRGAARFSYVTLEDLSDRRGAEDEVTRLTCYTLSTRSKRMLNTEGRSIELTQPHAQSVTRPSGSEVPPAVSCQVMDQDWADLSFLHWPYDPAVVTSLLPSGLTLQTFDGSAWVGLVPFVLRVRVPRGPALPWIGIFPETNVRTYVRGPDGHSGICFLSLDAPRRLAVWAARATYHLPYEVAAMHFDRSGANRTYSSFRLSGPQRGASSRARVSLGERISAPTVTPLEHFLTARWRLYASLRTGVGTATVAHEPYVLWSASATDVDVGLLVAAGLPPPLRDPLVHGCGDVRAAMGKLRPCQPGR